MICNHCGQEIIEPQIEVGKVVEVGANYFNVNIDALKSKNRSRENVYARQVIMWVLSKETNMNLRQVGEIFNRDHTTVIYAKENIGNLSKVYPHVSDDIKVITKSI